MRNFEKSISKCVTFYMVCSVEDMNYNSVYQFDFERVDSVSDKQKGVEHMETHMLPYQS